MTVFFGKRHAGVLTAIDSLECSRTFNERNFALVEYRDTQGKMRCSFDLTKDGLVFLAMSFTASGQLSSAQRDGLDYHPVKDNGLSPDVPPLLGRGQYSSITTGEETISDLSTAYCPG